MVLQEHLVVGLVRAQASKLIVSELLLLLLHVLDEPLPFLFYYYVITEGSDCSIVCTNMEG